MDDDLPGMLVSLIEHRGKEISDYHDGSSGLLCIFQLFDSTLETKKSAVSEGAAIVHATSTHMVSEQTIMLGEFLEENL